jgi:hypothetical protein
MNATCFENKRTLFLPLIAGFLEQKIGVEHKLLRVGTIYGGGFNH